MQTRQDEEDLVRLLKLKSYNIVELKDEIEKKIEAIKKGERVYIHAKEVPQ